MKKLLQFVFIVCFILTTSCGSTKAIDNSSRDGSSFEKAIIVNSIAEEYEYVKKACSNCQMLGQALVMNKKKPFDILRLKKSNGEEVAYYFDNSKFFGKGF